MTDFYLSKEQLFGVRSEADYNMRLNDARLIRYSGNSLNKITVFLSHKHEEIEVLENVIGMLKQLGVDVYIDWLDEGMPKTTCGETAQRIKQKIKECKKFILLATEGAIASKWCNWELGFGDAHRYIDNIAIMPITEKRRESFSGSEYLQIYPVIKSDYEYILSGCYVEYAGNRISLVEWLKR